MAALLELVEENIEDEGPHGEGWKSDRVTRLIASAYTAIESDTTAT